MHRKELSVNGAVASDIGNLNILLGRNGSGKSRYLRSLDEELSGKGECNVRYISPERAGVFRRDGSVITNMEQHDSWLAQVRRKNQADNFKAASAQLLRDVETAYLRKLQDLPEIRLDPTRTFYADRLERINRLLPNIRIEQEKSDFVFRSLSGGKIEPDQISSGESESVSLATEIMFFFDTLNPEAFNVLLLDEPDVHLHPDLQARLIHFLIQHIAELNSEMKARVAVFVATHSTPLVSAASASDVAKVGTKLFDNERVRFQSLDENIQKVGPFFGHPLSLSLSNDIMLIVEGEDDERVWQQAARSSSSRINVFPVIAQSVDVQSEMEKFCDRLLVAIYDEPKAYSIRDGDGIVGPLDAIGPVTRFRLRCYAIENALVTDECLSNLGCTWNNFVGLANKWIEENTEHRDVNLVRDLCQSADRLRNRKVKPIRQLVCAIAGSNKPWEVVVGQAIASLRREDLVEHGARLSSFLGVELVKEIVHPQSTTTEPVAS